MTGVWWVSGSCRLQTSALSPPPDSSTTVGDPWPRHSRYNQRPPSISTKPAKSPRAAPTATAARAAVGRVASVAPAIGACATISPATARRTAPTLQVERLSPTIVITCHHPREQPSCASISRPPDQIPSTARSTRVQWEGCWASRSKNDRMRHPSSVAEVSHHAIDPGPGPRLSQAVDYERSSLVGNQLLAQIGDVGHIPRDLRSPSPAAIQHLRRQP